MWQFKQEEVIRCLNFFEFQRLQESMKEVDLQKTQNIINALIYTYR